MGIFRAPTSGTYIITSTTMKWGKNTCVNMYHRKPMSSQKEIHHGRSSGTNYQMIPLTVMIDLTAGDEVYCKRCNDGNIHQNHTEFMGYIINPNN